MKKEKVAILPLSFGLRENFQEDTINKSIANLTDKISKKHNFPIIAEEIISVHLRKKPILKIKGNFVGSKNYIDTHAVLSKAKKSRIDNIILVGHPLHVGRASLSAKKLGYIVIAIHTIQEIYDKRSKHFQVRNKLFFKIHTFFAYLIYFIQRKI